MADFWLYLTLGFEHVLDWNGYDHILFLIVLCVSFLLKDWRKALLLISIFTIGHTLSMGLTVSNIFKVDASLVAILIPITILITSGHHIFFPNATKQLANKSFLMLSCFLFGIIHGFGFSLYFSAISGSIGSLINPFLGFMVGVETSQIIMVAVMLLLNNLVHLFFRISQRDWIMILSSIVIGLTLPLLFEAF